MNVTDNQSARNRILVSLGKLWRTRDELGFAQIRLPYLTYILPLAILLILHDLRSTYFFADSTIIVADKATLHSFAADTVTLNYIAFAIGALAVLLFFMKWVIGGMRCMALLLAAGFVFWLLTPGSDLKAAAMLIVHFGIGGCTIYATYTHVFVLKNAERLFSMCTVALIYGLFTFLYNRGIGGLVFSEVVPGLLILILVVCAFSFRRQAFPDTGKDAATVPAKGIYIVVICPLAFFIIDVFGEYLVNRGPAESIALRGAGTIASVLFVLIIQFGFRRSVWHMLNLFLIFTTVGILALALASSAPWRDAGSLLFGIGDGIGYVMIFYIVGIIKKYRNGRFFWNITIATIGAVFVSAMAANVLPLLGPDAMPAAAVVSAVGFLFAFQLLSPVIHRNIFASGWFDDLNKPDIEFMMKKVEQADRFGGLGLSPREKDVAVYLLRGFSVRQIAGVLGVTESTAKSYCKTLYRKLGINSRTELFVRFGVEAAETAGPVVAEGSAKLMGPANDPADQGDQLR